MYIHGANVKYFIFVIGLKVGGQNIEKLVRSKDVPQICPKKSTRKMLTDGVSQYIIRFVREPYENDAHTV